MRARDYITVDERGRTNLNRVRRPACHHIRQYLAEEREDGTIILTPAVTVAANRVPTSPFVRERLVRPA